jgi:hypothetical protein
MVLHVVAFVAGATLVLWVLSSAVRMVVLPRDEVVPLTKAVFQAVRPFFRLRLRRANTYLERDKAMARFAPTALVLIPGVWVGLSAIGFTGVFYGLGAQPLSKAFRLAGSSLLTLGFVSAEGPGQYVAAFVAATIGLGLGALLISYLPSIYAAFQRREVLVTRFAGRAGDPPSPLVVIRRHQFMGRLEAIDELWDEWETWFADVEESHTSQPSLVWFRSISPTRSWITAAGAALDTCALRVSTLDLPRQARPEVCIRAGFLCLRRIATLFNIPYDPDPRPDDPISITREEYDELIGELQALDVPLKPDLDQCWRDFAGWRVNYDAALIGLANLTMAPYAQWSSDRSIVRPGRRRFRVGDRAGNRAAASPP